MKKCEMCNKQAFSRGFCRKHYKLSMRYKNPRRDEGQAGWKGGVAYTNKGVFLRNKLIIIKKAKGICRGCKQAKIKHMHHINEDKKDHSLDNLQGLCASCHKKAHYLKNYCYKKVGSKYSRVYGMKISQIQTVLGISEYKIRSLHRSGKLHIALAQ